jgi:hypothetical protein
MKYPFDLPVDTSHAAGAQLRTLINRIAEAGQHA